MTSETRTLIDFSDIAGVEIECLDPQCGAKIVYPRNNHRIAKQCPNCNANLFLYGANGQSDSLNHITALSEIIDYLARHASAADLRAHVRLHVLAGPHPLNEKNHTHDSGSGSDQP